jgi:hypothetical protein
LLWALAADAPAVVIEAHFRLHSEYERAKLSALISSQPTCPSSCPARLDRSARGSTWLLVDDSTEDL